MKSLAALLMLGTAAVAGGYVVADGSGRKRPYRAAAELLAQSRGAQIVTFDPARLEPLRERLRRIQPARVAVVLRPRQIDFDFGRRFLQMATEIDDDPFPDFAFGYITGATAKEAVAFVRAGMNARPRKPTYGSLAGGCKVSAEYARPYLLRQSRIESVQGYVAGEQGDYDRKFARKFLEKLHRCSVVMFIGHGWPREVVGGLDYKDLPLLRLDGAVALNVGCYTGVTHTYYERDWQDGRLREKTVPFKESFALGVLRSGVVGYTAYLCPRPAGPELDTDLCALVAAGVTLGEARRRDYDKTVLGYLGFGAERLDLKRYEDGARLGRATDSVRDLMLEGATGGVLYGDPALRPFEERPGDHPVQVKTSRKGSTLQVDFSCAPNAVFLQCNDPTAMFGDSMAMKAYARVPLGTSHVVDVAVESVKVGAAEQPSRLIWAVEEDQGARYLQVKAMLPRAKRALALHATFLVETTSDPAKARDRGGEVQKVRPASKDPSSAKIEPFMLEVAERFTVSKKALQAALDANAAELRGGDEGKRKALSAFGSEGFRAVCALIEVGHHHYRTEELLRDTYRKGDEKHLLELAAMDDLPNFGSWTVLRGLGVTQSKKARKCLLAVLEAREDAGLFMSAAKGLAHMKEKKAVKPIGDQLLKFEDPYSGVERHLVGALADIGDRSCVRYFEAYGKDERARHADIAISSLELLDKKAAERVRKARGG